MSKHIFITFSSGNSNFFEAGKRLTRQVKNTKFFDKIIHYTDKELKNDKEFWDKHSEFILKNKKGYGLWIWKPYIIKKTMSIMNDGDILVYLDSGCEVGGKKSKLIPKFFDYVKKDKIIGTVQGFIEKEWTKLDLILHLDVNKEKHLNSPQRQAGACMYLVCKDTRNLVNLWYEIACNYYMLDDSLSQNPEKNYFNNHRHDQSIFSLLTKKQNIFSSKKLEDCVYVDRNRTGFSKLENNLFFLNYMSEKLELNNTNTYIVFIISVLIVLISIIKIIRN